MALILARISRGLRLAQALEQRLIRCPIRPDTAPAPLRAPADRPSRPPRRAVPRPPLPDMPTAEEIAAALRHRPAAAVIGDICRDLGIVPSHPLWQEVMVMLSGHGGNFMKLLNDFIERLRTSRADPSDDEAEGWPAPGSQLATPCGTGPP